MIAGEREEERERGREDRETGFVCRGVPALVVDGAVEEAEVEEESMHGGREGEDLEEDGFGEAGEEIEERVEEGVLPGVWG